MIVPTPAASSTIAATLEEMTGVLRAAGDEAAALETLALCRKLRDEQLQVVVMGEFKRGKSSLINALLGKPLLPVASVPLTSVVTTVQGGERDEAAVVFHDGRRQDIPLSAVEDYVSEEHNPKNHKQVERVAVTAAASFLGAGTFLVDTPGAGSVYRHNTEVAQKYLPNSDAVVLVLSADPPISQSEVEFLHSARRWARKLFIVLNKIDYLSASDLARAVSFSEKVLRDALDDSGAVLFPVSAKLALESALAGDRASSEKSGFAAFRSALRIFLEREKKAVVLEAARSKARSLLDRAISRVDIEMGVVQAGVEHWDENSRAIKDRLADAKRKQYELTKLYESELKDQIKALEEAIYTRARTEADRITLKLEALYAGIKGDPAAQVRSKLNREHLDSIEDSFTRFLSEEEPRWTAQFQRMTDRYLDNTVNLVNAVLGATASALGVPHRLASKPLITVAAPSVWFVIDEVSIWSGGFQSTPTMRIFKSFFWRALKRRIAESIDVNAGRLRYDYAARLQRAGGECLEAIQEFFTSSLAVLERASDAATEGRSRTQQDVAVETRRLRARKDHLSGLADRLAHGAP